MKLYYKQVLPFCMLLTLGLGACSSDEDVKEDINNIEQSNEKFSKLVINLGGEKGNFEGNITRALLGTQKGNWEDGWTKVNPADPAPSQVYPLNEIYLFVRQASDEAWNADQDITVLKYNLDEAKSFTMEYLASGNTVSLRSGDQVVKSLTPKGLDIMFVSQPKSVFETQIHPSLVTPNGNPVYAPCGDVLFRSKEYTLASDDSRFLLKQRGAEGVFEGSDTFVKNKLVMFRGSVSYNSKLIITDKNFKGDPKAIGEEATEGEQTGNHGCCVIDWSCDFFKKIIKQIRQDLAKKYGKPVAEISEQEAREVVLAYEGLLDPNKFLEQTGSESLNDWNISTFVAPSSTASENIPFPNKFNFFAYKPSDKLVAGQAMFNEGGGIVALTKQARAFVQDLKYPGFPIDYPEAAENEEPKPVDFEGVGKNFNYAASPYLYPFLIDGAYDLCFSITQKVRGGVKQATLRFPIKNAKLNEGQAVGPEDKPSIYPERLVTANRNIYTTLVIDLEDFVKQWKEVSAKVPAPASKGVSSEVVDLDANVLNIPYKMF